MLVCAALSLKLRPCKDLVSHPCVGACVLFMPMLAFDIEQKPRHAWGHHMNLSFLPSHKVKKFILYIVYTTLSHIRYQN